VPPTHSFTFYQSYTLNTQHCPPSVDTNVYFPEYRSRPEGPTTFSGRSYGFQLSGLTHQAASKSELQPVFNSSRTPTNLHTMSFWGKNAAAPPTAFDPAARFDPLRRERSDGAWGERGEPFLSGSAGGSSSSVVTQEEHSPPDEVFHEEEDGHKGQDDEGCGGIIMTTSFDELSLQERPAFGGRDRGRRRSPSSEDLFSQRYQPGRNSSSRNSNTSSDDSAVPSLGMESITSPHSWQEVFTLPSHDAQYGMGNSAFDFTSVCSKTTNTNI
jgi:hypothetical protein